MDRPTDGTLATEFGGADLGDRRLTQRLIRIVEAAEPRPAESFPKIAADPSALEGLYRFLGNPRVTSEKMLSPHYRETAKRADAEEEVIVPHDTTEFEFRGEAKRPGLSRIRKGGQGFFGHFALCLKANASREPIGILGLKTFFRTGPVKRLSRAQIQRKSDKESDRWWEMIEAVSRLLSDPLKAVHVMDREADAYGLLSRLRRQHRFVIRLTHDRNVEEMIKGSDRGSGTKLSSALESVEDVFEREVPISLRKTWHRPHLRRSHMPRNARIARLAFKAMTVTFRKPPFAGKTFSSPEVEPTITVNVVHVHEIDAPSDVQPVDWMLATSEPISTQEQLERIVDLYRARWVIEEYFKALKTGCSYETRQLETRRALLNALALFTPIAVGLLRLRSIAKVKPEAAASEVLGSHQLRALRYLSRKFRSENNATVKKAFDAIAALGGHLPQNGEPGWQVLWKGFSDVCRAAEIFQAADSLKKCDQS